MRSRATSSATPPCSAAWARARASGEGRGALVRPSVAPFRLVLAVVIGGDLGGSCLCFRGAARWVLSSA